MPCEDPANEVRDGFLSLIKGGYHIITFPQLKIRKMHLLPEDFKNQEAGEYFL